MGVLIIWCQPRGRSKKGERDLMEGIERMGMKRRIERAPKKPS